MNFKTVAVIVTLSLVIIFLGIDKCGSSRKADELEGRWREASEIAKVERLIKEEIIKEQKEKIVVLDVLIEVKNTTIARKIEKLSVILSSTDLPLFCCRQEVLPFLSYGGVTYSEIQGRSPRLVVDSRVSFHFVVS